MKWAVPSSAGISHWVLRRAHWAPWIMAFLWGAFAMGLVLRLWTFRLHHVPWIFLSVGLVVVLRIWAAWWRERMIREQPLPQYLKRSLRESYPGLTGKDVDLVERGLRQYFMACNRCPGQFVAMPSKVVDSLWHAFILHTKAYEAWCALVLGRFLHHTPAEAMGTGAARNDGLRRAWYWACKEENINPRKPTRLPLLFALDSKLAIPDGFSYVPDCHAIAAKSDANGDGTFSYCATDFSDGSCSGASDSFGGIDSDGSGSTDGGDGGGSGCGGGCGGD